MRWLMRIRRGLRRLLPRTFQGRLTVAFVSVIALTLAMVTVLVVNRLDDYFATQAQRDLESRLNTVSSIIQDVAHDAALGRPIVDAERGVAPAVAQAMREEELRSVVADQLGQADVSVRFGHLASIDQQVVFVPAPDGQFQMDVLVAPGEGQTRESTTTSNIYSAGTLFSPYAFQVTLTDPYTYRATAIANVTGLLAAITLAAMGLAVVVSAMLARRFTTPLRQLTDASRALAEGDLSRRVPVGPIRAGAYELGLLAVQFNAMADRLEESVEIIRSDRDRSRDFLADVSHELRTPLAALRTFNQLLMESAGDDPDARAEFLESSAGQIDRLDWLAQNLLELSKLDSGLVLLDLRPDDLRAAVESAAHQHDATAARRGVTIVVDLPEAPIRIHHDPPRIGQVVANLVGNAVKFTPRGGSVRVSVASTTTGARIDVADTGVGIEFGGAAAHLRALLSRIAGQRGTGQRQWPRPRDRAVHRGHARRHGHGRERSRSRQPVHGHAAARPADRGRIPGRGQVRGGHGGRGLGTGRRDHADPCRAVTAHGLATRRRLAGSARGQHDGNFTVRRVADESRIRTLRRTNPPSRPLTGRSLQGARTA